LNRQPHELGNSQTARELGVNEKAVRNASDGGQVRDDDRDRKVPELFIFPSRLRLTGTEKYPAFPFFRPLVNEISDFIT